jgi:hypothetical protein
MVDIKTSEANPVGQVVTDESIDTFIEDAKVQWDESNKIEQAQPWYKFWTKKGMIIKATKFILHCLDQFVVYVDEALDNSADKKATVIYATEQIYDHVIVEAMPIWLKPFAPKIKDVIFNSILSPFIDWIVSKYRQGWKKPKSLLKPLSF